MYFSIFVPEFEHVFVNPDCRKSTGTMIYFLRDFTMWKFPMSAGVDGA